MGVDCKPFRVRSGPVCYFSKLAERTRLLERHVSCLGFIPATSTNLPVQAGCAVCVDSSEFTCPPDQALDGHAPLCLQHGQAAQRRISRHNLGDDMPRCQQLRSEGVGLGLYLTANLIGAVQHKMPEFVRSAKPYPVTRSIS